MNRSTDFDALLRAALMDYCEDWDAQNDPLRMGTLPEITARERRRFQKLLRDVERRRARVLRTGVAPRYMSPFKVALIAVLMSLAVALTACVCIREWRLAVKEIFTQWFTGYVAVDFHGGSHIEPVSETAVPQPDRILQKAYVADLSEGYTVEEWWGENGVYIAKYYVNGEFVFTLSQIILSNENSWLNSEKHNWHRIQIGEYEALMFFDTEGSSKYKVVWQDLQYEYRIYGYFADAKAVIHTAENVMLEN